MQRCLRVSKEQNIETTKGFSAKVRMSRSTNTCWIWFLSIRFCRLIFFMAKRWRVSLWRTRNTALCGRRREERGQKKRKKENYRTNGDRRVYEGLSGVGKEGGEKDVETYTSLTSEHHFRLEMELSRQILSVTTEILQQHIPILVSLPLLLGYLRRRLKDWVKCQQRSLLLTHRRHC